MQGTLLASEIDELLHLQPFGRIGCHSHGRTYVVPVGYAYDGRRLFFHSGEGLKVQMMRENPEVCFEIDEVVGLGAWKSVIVWGRFVELKETEAAVALGLLIDKLTPLLEGYDMPKYGMRSVTPPARGDQAIEPVVYAIEIREKTGRFEKL